MTRAIAFVLLALPAVVNAQAGPTAATTSQAAVARTIDSLATAFIAGAGAPSVAIAVVRGADTIALRAWGKADLEHDVAATPETVYRIGSVTKQFTAAAVMQLVEQEKLSLDDSIGAHLAGLPAAWRGVTVRQLLNHTSGIPSYTGAGEAWRSRWGVEMPPESLLAITARDTMWFRPGTSYRYDNTGYVLLGMLVEKHAGRPWGADMEERFFKPLGLAHTFNCLADPVIPHRARGYERSGSGWVNTPYLAMSQPYAAGAICSTVGDLARWNRALHTGKVVSAESYRMMTTPEGAATESGYGFGLGREKMGELDVIDHGGGIHGFISANAWVPGPELSVTVLTNSGSARADDLLRQVARAAMGLPLVQPPTVKPLAAADRARYVGVYSLPLPPGPRDFTVAEGADGITGQLQGQGAIPLLHYGDHTFGASFDPSVRIVFTVEGGRATRMALVQGGRRIEGARK
ncbi:MAG TPA: serine hydrolase domain-containing protein [Gemmatimonadales bacterium]